MKSIKLIIAAALLSGVSTLALAGPSPQFWDQQSKQQQEQKAKAEARAKTDQGAKVCGTCSCCSGVKKS